MNGFDNHLTIKKLRPTFHCLHRKTQTLIPCVTVLPRKDIATISSLQHHLIFKCSTHRMSSYDQTPTSPPIYLQKAPARRSNETLFRLGVGKENSTNLPAYPPLNAFEEDEHGNKIRALSRTSLRLACAGCCLLMLICFGVVLGIVYRYELTPLDNPSVVATISPCVAHQLTLEKNSGQLPQYRR